MDFVSTRVPDGPRVSLRRAVLDGLAPDGGLYVPTAIPALDPDRVDGLADLSFHDLGVALARGYVSDELTEADLRRIVERALDFPIPLVWLDDQTAVLELFHGPTFAFKDVGAQFMAGLMGAFSQDEDEALVVLTATSGDTGGAVAAGFAGVDGVQVGLLYPEGRVSELQEKQIAGVGGNVHAARVAGSFDDCQALVKGAFADSVLRARLRLTSANSINIARLLPQSFYYAEAVRQARLAGRGEALTFVVPSGNFGNLTAGLLAKRAGVPMSGLLAATNENRTVPDYLAGGDYAPAASVHTLSSAMDVGAPSNFERLRHLFGDSRERMASEIGGAFVTDAETEAAIVDTFERFGYVADPHTAVGLHALAEARREGLGGPAVVFSTAHPVKFADTVERVLGRPIEPPPGLADQMARPVHADPLPPNAEAFREWLLSSVQPGAAGDPLNR